MLCLIMYFAIDRPAIFLFRSSVSYIRATLKRLVWQALRTSLFRWYRCPLRPALSLCKMVVRGVRVTRHATSVELAEIDRLNAPLGERSDLGGAGLKSLFTGQS